MDQKKSVYFNIDSLINANIAYLSKVQPKLEKHALIDEKTNQVFITPKDSTSWANELDIFRQIDLINKPINHSSYLIENDLRDSKSNLSVYRFTSKSNLPLKFLEIYYHNEMGHIRKIRAQYTERNKLYMSSRFLTLYMHDFGDKNVITSYSIEGGQKMILGDSVNFKILATVIFSE